MAGAVTSVATSAEVSTRESPRACRIPLCGLYV